MKIMKQFFLLLLSNKTFFIKYSHLGFIRSGLIIFFAMFFISCAHHGDYHDDYDDEEYATCSHKEHSSCPYADKKSCKKDCKKPCCKHKKFCKWTKEGKAWIYPVNKSKVSGWVSFQKQAKKQVLVKAEVRGLKPNKKYGFHIHEYGNCRNNGKNAGGHFNPKGHKHGSADSAERHMGDLGNLKADKNGRAVYEKTLKICMKKVGGRSVIVHAGPDDLKSQPSGNAGPYIGCGLIGYVKPTKKPVAKPVVPKPAPKKPKALKKKSDSAKADSKKKPDSKKAKSEDKAAKTPKANKKSTPVKKEATPPTPPPPAKATAN